MTRALPKEEREKIIAAIDKGLGTVTELAEIFDITERTIYKYLRQRRETGDLTPYTQPGRPPVITNGILDTLHNIVSKNPDLTLDNYRIMLEKETGISVTIVTIHNACKELDLRRKKKFFRIRTRTRRCPGKKNELHRLP